MRKLIALTAMSMLVLTACASGDGSLGETADSSPGQETLPTAAPDSSSTTEQPNPELEPGDPAPPSPSAGQDLPGTDPDRDELVDTAVADLAEMLSVDSHAIIVVTVESVTWRDGSMGCPEPGMSYTQALVNGVRVELTLDGTSYWYHQGGTNPIRYCVDPNDEVGTDDWAPNGSKFIPPTTTP